MIVCFVIYGLLIILFVLSAEEKSSKKGLQRVFHRMGLYGVRQLERRGAGHFGLLLKEEERLLLLHPASDAKAAAREELASRIAMGLMLLFAGTTLSLLLGLKELGETNLSDGIFLERAAYGEGSREVNLKVHEAGAQKEHELSVPVKERRYTDDEVDRLFAEVEKELYETIRGENKSLDYVCSNLKLVESLPGYPVEIAWQSGNYDVMDESGCLTGKGTDKEGTLVELKARLTYFEQSKIITFAVKVYPQKQTAAGAWLSGLKKQIARLDKESAYQEKQKLPESFEGKRLVWSKKTDMAFGWFLLLTLIAAVGIPVGKWREGKKQLEERKRQMLMDYPDVLNKLVLFLGAGMTVSAAFRRLAAEYEERRHSDATVKKDKAVPAVRYAYEEMAVTTRELESGADEAGAYERFGERCRVQQYLKLGTLLSQNLKKGTKDLTDMLELEAKEAFEARKRLARKQGEEAGTRLLVPMVMMLGVVLLIVTVPAFVSFGF